MLKIDLTISPFCFFLITEVCRHTCPPGSPSCIGSLPILPGGPSPKAPGLVLGLQPQLLPLPTLSKTPISSLQQICLLLCTWPRSQAVSLGSDKSLLAVDVLLSVYTLPSPHFRWLPVAFMMQPKLPRKTSHPSLTTPDAPAPASWAQVFSPWTCLVSAQVPIWDALYLQPLPLRTPLTGPRCSSSQARPRGKVPLCPLRLWGTWLSLGWSIYHILLKLLMFLSYRPDYGLLWGRNRVSNLSLLKAPSGWAGKWKMVEQS